MKRRFYFAGSSVSDMMGVVSWRRFGQSAELTADQARDLTLGGSAIVPEAAWQQIGWEPADAKYAEFGAHQHAPESWQEKRRAALAAGEKFREEMAAPAEEGAMLTEVANG